MTKGAVVHVQANRSILSLKFVRRVQTLYSKSIGIRDLQIFCPEAVDKAGGAATPLLNQHSFLFSSSLHSSHLR